MTEQPRFSNEQAHPDLDDQVPAPDEINQGLARLLPFSNNLLENTESELDYQSICDDILIISGGKYAIFNQFDENEMVFQTMAISGFGETLQKITELLGSGLMGKKWPYKADLLLQTAGDTILHFPSIFELAGPTLPPNALETALKIFTPGEAVFMRISTQEKLIGNFAIIMPPGKKFKADSLVTIYTRQVGLLLKQKQTEAALRASKTNLRAVIENSGGSIWSIDLQYRLIISNQQFQKHVNALVGRRIYKGENMLSLDLQAQALAEWKGYYDRALQGETFSIETMTRTQTDVRNMAFHFTPVHFFSGSSSPDAPPR